ncbi:uncharacterized protein FYW49_011259 [Xenentodon cancila]
MCDCFHLAFPNWHAASSGTGAGRRLRGPETPSEDSSICEESSQFAEGERPRPQGSSPVEEYPESAKYTYSDKEAEHDPHHKTGSGYKSKRSGLGSMFERRSTPKMSKLKEVHSPEAGVIVKTPKDGCSEGLIYAGGGKDGIFIKEVMPESPASKSLKVKEGDQILSATVYFDNVSYEDAVQILEHAQAYKMKLCLKRKPDITEMESATASDIIPEEDIQTAEMREEGKSKRRGDARISWPKFPSFGKGRKSRFTRSHSSSEADEQRTLELSPTTSETESPIKSQNALKGKKKDKKKLPGLTKRGRISSSEDQDTEAPTTGEISGDIQQKQDTPMLSPESLEGPSGETQGVTEDIKTVEAFGPEQSNQTKTDGQCIQHKVELISLDSTLKTADLTVALADQGSPSGSKSHDKKKKKKEKSELKMKILGKEKSPKKDAKAKSSPKRLKTLGASIETEDLPETEKSGVGSSFEFHTKLGDQPALDTNNQILSKSMIIEMNLPKVELDIPDAEFVQKSPKKPKQVIAGQTSTLIGDITTEPPTEGAQIFCETRSKGSVSTVQLPKREDIVIPGMEDISSRTTKGMKQPKAKFTGHDEEIPAETVQMSIDVESVKEAVSKLPGFKLPQVDTSGMPIPEEITVIDANAQRISVKTPTKVAETKSKHESPLTKIYMSTSPEISMTVQLPKLTSDDLIMEESLTGTRLELQKPQTEHKFKPKEMENRKMEIEKPKVEIKTTEGQAEVHGQGSRFRMPKFGIKMPKIKGPEFDIHVSKKDRDGVLQEKAEMQLSEAPDTDICPGKVDVSIPEQKVEVEVPQMEIKTLQTEGELEAQGGKFKMPKFGIKMPKIKGPEFDIHMPKKDRDGVLKEEAGMQPSEGPETDICPGKVDVSIPEQKVEVEVPQMEIKTLQTEGELEAQGGKFKMPKFGIKMPKIKGPEFDIHMPKKDRDGVLQEKAEMQLSEAPDSDICPRKVDVSIPEQKVEVEVPQMKIKSLQTEGELEAQGGKFKMPKFGIKMPKIKGPEFDIHMPKKDRDGVLKEEAGMQPSEGPETDICPGKVDVSIPEQKVEVEVPQMEIKSLPTEGELEAQGGKFKMPKFGIKMPKIKGPEFDIHMSKKDTDGVLQEEAGMQPSEGPETDFCPGKVDVSIPEQKVEVEVPQMEIKSLPTEGELEAQGGKFKMPKFGIKMPKIKGPEFNIKLSTKEADVTLTDAKTVVQLPEVSEADVRLDVSMPEQKMELEKPKLDIKTLQSEGEPDEQEHKFKMPKLGIATPKVKGPEIDLSLSKTDEDVTQPAPSTDVEGLSMDEKPAKAEHEMKGNKFKMPYLGFSMPKVKGPKLDLSLSKKETEVKLPEAKADVKLPKVDLEKVDIAAPEASVEVKTPELEMQALEIESRPTSTKAPETDISLEVDVATPDAKVDVHPPESNIKESSKPPKSSEKGEQSPVGKPVDEEMSPTCSVQSSDAFADISSTMTSEQVGLSLSSPTKVTVKYSDPSAATGLGEKCSDVITSTTRTELITDVPNLPEKVTILSSGVSSSSEDTLRLESGKIHVITSNIQATPETQHAKLLSAIQIQSAGSLLLTSEDNEAASWTAEDSQSEKRTVFERHLVRETSRGRSETKETLVVTKQITHSFDMSEPISGQTASSLQRLKDSVHSEKMRFFEGAEK